MKKTTLAALAAFGGASAWGQAPQPGEGADAAELPPVIVEATRLDLTAMETPADVQVITRDDIAASGAKDLPDLLAKTVPTLHVSGLGAGNPALRQVSLRGWGENGFGRTLVLVDGERLNNPDMSAPNLAQVNLGAVRKIEILHGPQTVLQGDGASAGVINIVTDAAADDYGTHGTFEVTGGSWNTIATRASLRGGDEETRSRWWTGGGWEHGDGYRHRTGYDIWNANGGIRQDWENGSFLRASVFYNDSDYELPGGLTRAQWHGHPTQAGLYRDDFYRRTTYGLNMTGSFRIDDANELRLIGTASRRHMKSRTYNYYTVDYDMYSYELTPEWICTADVGGLDNTLILGTTYRYDRLHATMYGTGKSALNRQSMAFFGQDTLNLTDSVALQAGLRYQRGWSENTQLRSPRRADDLFAGEAALLFTPHEDLKTYVKFARFFRSPFLDEYVSLYDPATFAYSSDSMLAPERGWSVDVGAAWTFLDECDFAANAYVTRTKHEIMYDPWYRVNNINYRGDTLREGVDLRLAWERDKVAGLAFACSYVKAEFDGGDYDGKTVPMVPETTVSLNGKVWLWDDCFVFGGYRYQSYMWSVSDFRNNGGYTGDKSMRVPAYGLFHVGVTYAPGCDWLKGWKATFTVDNLFDRNYCEWASYGTSYYPGAGRSYMFTLSYAF